MDEPASFKLSRVESRLAPSVLAVVSTRSSMFANVYPLARLEAMYDSNYSGPQEPDSSMTPRPLVILDASACVASPIPEQFNLKSVRLLFLHPQWYNNQQIGLSVLQGERTTSGICVACFCDPNLPSSFSYPNCPIRNNTREPFYVKVYDTFSIV